jgi:hypothetical protein
MVDTSRFTRLLLVVAVIFASTAFAVAPVVAQNESPDWGQDLYDEMGPMVDRYNENVDAGDAGLAGDQLKGETVNLVVADANGTDASYSFEIDDQLRISDLDDATRDDATLRMSTDRGTMDSIVDAEDPSTRFQNAITSSDITIDGLGNINAIKWAIINLLVSIFG